MLQAFGATDPGCVRSNNEDYLLMQPPAGLYVVADGMGGAQAGEFASKMAAETVWEAVSADPGQMDEAKLVSAFEQANHKVKSAAEADRSLEGMGTTLLAALDRGGEVLIASVGDSRAYRFHDGALEVITDDQTWVNEVGRRLGLDEASLKTHPMRHVLTMAVGVSDQLRVNTYTLQPPAGAQILLCSDGLHGVVTEDEIRAELSADGTGETRCKNLIALARKHGGPDNITVILLEAPAD
jgi:protein phosphatase